MEAAKLAAEQKEISDARVLSTPEASTDLQEETKVVFVDIKKSDSLATLAKNQKLAA